MTAVRVGESLDRFGACQSFFGERRRLFFVARTARVSRCSTVHRETAVGFMQRLRIVTYNIAHGRGLSRSRA